MLKWVRVNDYEMPRYTAEADGVKFEIVFLAYLGYRSIGDWNIRTKVSGGEWKKSGCSGTLKGAKEVVTAYLRAQKEAV